MEHEKGANINKFYTFLFFIVIVVVSSLSLIYIRRIYFFTIRISALWNRSQYYSLAGWKSINHPEQQPHAHGVCKKTATKLEDEQIVLVRLISIDNLLNFNGHLQTNKKCWLRVLHDWRARFYVYVHTHAVCHTLWHLCATNLITLALCETHDTGIEITREKKCRIFDSLSRNKIE